MDKDLRMLAAESRSQPPMFQAPQGQKGGGALQDILGLFGGVGGLLAGLLGGNKDKQQLIDPNKRDIEGKDLFSASAPELRGLRYKAAAMQSAKDDVDFYPF